ncbi:MAG: MBL fold metallo-hydrolase [Phenylobacterium sp.]|uniref:MBL fold metallo-hydrolase n=1 Tax=Phenylobacterium sp. TaxID=1871053 RepID=UPI0027217D87|nr:MBL fold metallo-hydrolase [Phenylobacterium sp.]MDO8911889.1 MBL fold metallo-hydrolase [Phenylobacterium sp.]MDP3101724.1 MBL fold metallo-hydrolase [Phenylobacterium sp.]
MIPYVREIKFDYGKADQVSPLIRRVVANNPGPFTYLGTGTYIIGRGEVAVIDPGPDMDEHLEAILGTLEPGEKITHILITHHHSDHSPLAGPLKARTGATIYGCAVAEIPVDDSGVRMEAGADFGFSPDVSLCGGSQVLEGPGWTLEAIATPGHTSNHICFALKEENALFSGDHIMGWSTTVITPPDGDMTDYMDSLDLVKARDFSILWPTHGPPVTEVAPFIDAYIAHRRAREAQVLKAVTEGHGRIREMVPVLYADVDPRLHPAAARSVLGHMIDLVKRGLVTTDGKPGPDSDYRRA